jgi:hypothetical protein
LGVAAGERFLFREEEDIVVAAREMIVVAVGEAAVAVGGETVGT